MPWKEQTLMSLRQEFVERALSISENSTQTFAELCRQFGISRKTGYKWLSRLLDGTTVYPLTVLDDHSRYLLAVRPCPAADPKEVVRVLTELFQEFGLPDALLKDNGPPCGDEGHERYTTFEVWLIRLGIKPLRSRPHHPQTLDKDERLHRTMEEELIAQAGPWEDPESAQAAFAMWREVYNTERPHEALGGAVPADLYRPSSRRWEGDLPPLEFPAQALIRKVDRAGYIFSGTAI